MLSHLHYVFNSNFVLWTTLSKLQNKIYFGVIMNHLFLNLKKEDIKR